MRFSHHFKRARPLLCTLALAMATQVAAETATLTARDYQLDAGPLGRTLSSVAVQASIPLSFDTALTRGKNAPTLSGNYTPLQALEALLNGSGLQLVRKADGSYTLQVISGTPRLATVAVSGKAMGSTTEGTGSYTTESTSSSTRLNLSLQETPQPISVITRQRMEDQGLNTLNEVLDATTGITVKSFGVGGDGPQLWARGSSITNFQVEGVPSSSSMSNYLQSSVMYDRVEIVKGATGMMSGLGTPSATVNMIRKRPTGEPLTDITMEGGTWSRYGVGLDVSRTLNEEASVRGRLVADYKNQQAWADNYQQEYGVLYGIGEVDLGINTLLTLGFSHITRNTDAPIRPFFIQYSNGQPNGAKPSNYAAPSWTYYDHQLNSLFSSVEHTFDSGWSAKAELTHTRYKYDAIIASLQGGVDQLTGLGAYAQMPLWANEAEQTSLDSYITGPFTLFGRQHEVIGGITLSQVDQESPGYPTYRQNVTDIFNWTNTISEPTFIQTGDVETKENQFSAYLSSRLQVSDATSLLLGGRITDWERDRKAFTYANSSVSNSRDREHNVVIPYLGIVHELNNILSLYSSYTRIFNPHGVRVRDVNNMSLDPEEGTSYEAGIKAGFNDGALTSSLSLFRTEQDNLALYNIALVAYEAANNAVTEGVEVELNGQLAEGWQFSAGYTYSETKDKDGQRVMTRIPRNSVKLFTTYRLPGDWNRFTLGGGINWESKTGDDYIQGGYALMKLMARYEVNKQLAITAHLNNALDKEYYVALGGSGGTFGDPRNFMISAKYSF
ncbi:TonB-dependent siderophore receptor [Cellvibrio polysaccharolyticus]|uniref:TonB-dependent siderophore receptor n=1 Tax=Cellvibrio polysaccharolyticus TaxID=2082724 RepID=A0A928V3S7_9GAMM|nr:TonB-dependent siderophore receptor [Cellvibrio polysaccharolyticus]MBE8718231.1 TonB-dependent siderophore receptor [Cellvibrio polysaccharolyticus]